MEQWYLDSQAHVVSSQYELVVFAMSVFSGTGQDDHLPDGGHLQQHGYLPPSLQDVYTDDDMNIQLEDLW